MAITIPHFAPLGSMALSFDGRGGYVHVQDHPSLRLAEFTIEAWVRPGGAPSSTGALLARADALGGVCNYGLALRGDTLTLELRMSVEGSSGCALSLPGRARLRRGVWSHVAATFDGATATLVLDGEVDVRQGLRLSPSRSEAPLRLGGGGPELSPFQGELMRVRLFRFARPAEALRRPALDPLGPGEGLVADFRLDEGYGGFAFDSSRSALAGALVAAPSPPRWVVASSPRAEPALALGGLDRRRSRPLAGWHSAARR